MGDLLDLNNVCGAWCLFSSSMAEAQSYEEQFAHRFSAQDEEFQRYLQQPAVQPPVVEAWRSRDARYELYDTDKVIIHACVLLIYR